MINNLTSNYITQSPQIAKNPTTPQEIKDSSINDSVTLSISPKQEKPETKAKSQLGRMMDKLDLHDKPTSSAGALGTLAKLGRIGLDTVMFGIDIGAGIIQEFGISGAAAIGLGGAVTAASAFFAIKGTKGIIEAVKTKDPAKGIEAGCELALAGDIALRTGTHAANAGILGGTITPAASAFFNSPITKLVGTTLGLGMGTVETVLGSKEIYDGIKTKDKKTIASGVAAVGMGVATAAAALGGGLPAGIAMAAFFAVDVVLKWNEYKTTALNLTKSAKRAMKKSGMHILNKMRGNPKEVTHLNPTKPVKSTEIR